MRRPSKQTEQSATPSQSSAALDLHGSVAAAPVVTPDDPGSAKPERYLKVHTSLSIYTAFVHDGLTVMDLLCYLAHSYIVRCFTRP